MIYGIYAMHDALTCFLNPVFEMNDECAVRNFKFTMTKDWHEFVKEDFSLYKIGTYDADTGVIVPVIPPERMA